MKVYIRKNKHREFPSPNFAIAYDAFSKMGWEVIGFQPGEQKNGLTPDCVVVGYVDDVHYALRCLQIALPVEDTYPEVLASFLGRKVWRSKINYIAGHPELWPIFIKPATATKKFTGRLVTGTKSLVSCGDEFEDTEIWCSEPVQLVSEYRCFVRYGKILDVRLYRGDWRVSLNAAVVEAAVASFVGAPVGYAIDFGCTVAGETVLIEVNDGYSIGAYGLLPVDYAQLLSARWAEITGTIDQANY
jgi:hypothetical protein